MGWLFLLAAVVIAFGGGSSGGLGGPVLTTHKGYAIAITPRLEDPTRAASILARVKAQIDSWGMA